MSERFAFLVEQELWKQQCAGQRENVDAAVRALCDGREILVGVKHIRLVSTQAPSLKAKYLRWIEYQREKYDCAANGRPPPAEPAWLVDALLGGDSEPGGSQFDNAKGPLITKRGAE